MPRSLLIAALALASAAPVQARVPDPDVHAPRRPNVLLVLFDDLGSAAGVLGGPARMPALDHLAASGLLFTSAHAQAPTCNPSRVSLLLGRRPTSTGVYFNTHDWRRLVPDARPLPTSFRAAGYATWSAGKVFHGRKSDDALWDAVLHAGSDHALAERPVSPAPGFAWEASRHPVERFDDHRIVDWACEKLREPSDAPFLLAVGLGKPHLPWIVPAHCFPDPDDVPPPPSGIAGAADLDDVPEAALAQRHEDDAALRARGLEREARRAYLAACAFADFELGRLLRGLAAGPHADDTIVVVTSDHGMHQGEKGWWRKNTLWEPSTRVPLVIRLAGDRAPGVWADPVELLDLHRTLLELAGIEPPPDIEGRSLAPLLAAPATLAESADPEAGELGPVALTHRGPATWSARSRRWRYVRHHDGSEELYDRAGDPGEHRNLLAEGAGADAEGGSAPHLAEEVERALSELRELAPRGVVRRQR